MTTPIIKLELSDYDKERLRIVCFNKNYDHILKQVESGHLLVRAQVKLLLKIWGKRTPKEDEIDVHTEHCCELHGCKYHDDYCPVIMRDKVQSFICESCQWDVDEFLRGPNEIAQILSE